MQVLFKPLTAALLVFSSLTTIPSAGPAPDKSPVTIPVKKTAPRIQVAVLLDVSNSMDGLINQAKAQLWNMVNVLGKASCDNVAPTIEIALYEYGRSSNKPTEGYVKQINTFTNDLDLVSKNLFDLTTNGGDEFCGHVMYNSLTQMNWDSAATSYKVIFIAGNEDFLQGDISFSKACEEAKKKNVIINTIYCGSKQQGIRENWQLGSECGLGSFTNINSDAQLDDIATPYDSTLFVLNNRLNSTYIGYGAMGAAGAQKQAYADNMNYSLNKSAAAKRVAVKGQAQLYSNAGWDMVDAQKADSNFIKKLNRSTLTDSLKTKSSAELEKIITAKSKERAEVQKQIAEVSVKRESYINTARAAKNDRNTKEQTLETEIEKIIRQQASRYNMVIK